MAPKKPCTKRATAPAQEPKTPAVKIASSTTSKTPAAAAAKAPDETVAMQAPAAKKVKAPDEAVAAQAPAAKKVKAPDEAVAAQAPAAKKVKASDEAVAAQAPAAKKAKVDPMLIGVEEGILQASGLPEVVRDMLLAGLPGSLCCAQRYEVQEAIMRMADVTLRGVEATLQSALETEEAAVLATDAARESCKTRVTDADAFLTVVKQTAEVKKAAVATATRELETAQAVLAENVAAQRVGDAPIEKARRSKDELDKAIDVNLAAVLAGDDIHASKAHCEALLPIAASLGLDESLRNALPAACGKRAPERGHFDKVVVDALETSLKEGREAVIQTLAHEAPASEERAATVNASETDVANAKEGLRQATEESTQADAQEMEAAKAKQAALEAVEHSEPDCKEAATRRDEQTEKLNHFRTYNLNCFDVLRQKGSKREEATLEKGDTLPAEDAAMKIVEAPNAEMAVPISVGGA